MTIWFGLCVTAQKEFRAAQMIRDNGIVTFVATEYRWRQRGGGDRRRIRAPYPFLPGYVFVGFDDHDIPWHLVFGCYQARVVRHRRTQPTWRRNDLVHSILGAFGMPQRIPHAVMEYLFKRTAKLDEAVTSSNMFRTFKVGDLIRLADREYEAFAEWSFPVTEIVDDRVKVLMEMFGSRREITVPMASVVAA